MADQQRAVTPKTFFLNERQQLRELEKKGGGGQAKLRAIDWTQRSQRIRSSLDTLRTAVSTSKDPLGQKRLFVLATPVSAIPKFRESNGVTENYEEVPDFRKGEYAQVFGRLGLDLVDMTSTGAAVVHASPSRFEELVTEAGFLPQAGVRQHARWLSIDSFGLVPAAERLDFQWAQSIDQDSAADVVFEAQPLLSRAEADIILRAVAGYGKQRGEKITGTGQDYSGRQWVRGTMLPETLREIAQNFSSVQSIHPPLYAKAATRAARSFSAGQGLRDGNFGQLPTVAVLDHGIPANHVLLSQFARAGPVVPRGAASGYWSDHGSHVASRIVYGAVENFDNPLNPECRFLDVRVSDEPIGNDDPRIDPKVVTDAFAAVRATFPDVRVFNLSFNTSRPFQSLDTESKKEWFRILRDLDNFAFDNDVAVIVASGNIDHAPLPAYPNHISDGRCGMGFWSCGYNTLGCGSYVGHPSQGGLGDPDWPSPFTRIGPGICDCRLIPAYSAPGGNLDSHHHMQDGMGELVCDADGRWGESVGTSLAAPLLAREVAKALDQLQQKCPPNVRPFTCTAKAVLALTAERRHVPTRLKELAELTLGMGLAHSRRLLQPIAGSAVFVWQGEITSTEEKLRIVLPIPLEWINAAGSPHLRLIVSWETPVNDASSKVWACRKVEVQLRSGVDEDLPAATGSRGSHSTYPLIDRTFSLTKAIAKAAPVDNSWVVEVSYTEQKMAEYYPTVQRDRPQRVGLAIELFDSGNASMDPQRFIQALPVELSLDRLAIPRSAVMTPLGATRPI